VRHVVTVKDERQVTGDDDDPAVRQ
jgi:hypothetical protein